MEKILWSERYSVNNDILDSQHKKLINLLNEIQSVMNEVNGREIIGVIIDELAAYSKLHFSIEEMLMKKANYNGYTEHKEEHGKFINKISEIREVFRTGTADNEMMNSLKKWCVEHLERADKKYASEI
jgi:hemerythrin-like metal-binding protein